MMKRTAKILLVEDNALDAKIITDSLRKKNYRIVGHATSVEEAMPLIARRKPDLVLMDITLKGEKDGIWGASQIQQTMNIPVLFLSGFLSDDVKQRILEAEPSGFLIKPFNEQELHINVELALYKAGMKKELELKEIRFQSMVKALPDLLINYDRQGNYLEATTQDKDLMPIGLENVKGKNILEVLPESLARSILLCIERAIQSGSMQTLEYELETFKGERIFEMRLAGSGENEAVAIVRDVTEARKTEEELIYLRFRDRLTDLYNRDFFEEELQRLDTERQYPLSVIISDIDGLKMVNDVLGHQEGDKLVQRAAQVMKDCFRDEDIICRTGGDEFTILLPQTNEADTRKMMRRIREKAQEMTYKGEYTQMALGAATKVKSTMSTTELLKEADDNMYQNKLTNRDNKLSDLLKILEKTPGFNPGANQKYWERLSRLNPLIED
ncbi:MAG: diguanylate cyclase [Tindallia sp. MSAO_Bac2]|nr:MAG: diguanylate cyclase [Tindallia sp. MSAO_Bac2]